MEIQCVCPKAYGTQPAARWHYDENRGFKPDYLEYEIVKGDESFEVQIDFDKNSNKATKVDVTLNPGRPTPPKKRLNSTKPRRGANFAQYSCAR